VLVDSAPALPPDVHRLTRKQHAGRQRANSEAAELTRKRAGRQIRTARHRPHQEIAMWYVNSTGQRRYFKRFQSGLRKDTARGRKCRQILARLLREHRRECRWPALIRQCYRTWGRFYGERYDGVTEKFWQWYA
jgi:hypothetical protein